jgi:hypothetical protein
MSWEFVKFGVWRVETLKMAKSIPGSGQCYASNATVSITPDDALELGLG